MEIRKIQKKHINCDSTKKSIATKKLWKSDSYRSKVIQNITKPKSKKSKKNYSKEMKRRRNTEEYIRRMIQTNHNSPNKSEKFLRKILNKHFPKSYSFVGNGKVIIGNRCPDFLDKKTNRIIELYGRYWHSNDNPEDKIQYYNSFGYSCLVIWDDELKDVDALIAKINEFHQHDVLRESPTLAAMRDNVVNIG